MRCEGYRRYYGAFTLGKSDWEQCKEEATVLLKVKGKELPACKTCWEEAANTPGISIQWARPIPKEPDHA